MNHLTRKVNDIFIGTFCCSALLDEPGAYLIDDKNEEVVEIRIEDIPDLIAVLQEIMEDRKSGN